MHRIIPDLIIQNYRAGRYQGAFDAASLFLDLSGFSAMTDVLMRRGQEGAETLAVMIGAVFDPMVEAILGQGGIITGYAGDSIAALYPTSGDPTEAARRALASAQAIQHRLAATPAHKTPYGASRISAKIGLGMGSAMWGILRSRPGDKALYYFRGSAVDQAAAAERQALPGDIAVADDLRRVFGDDIETKPDGSFHLISRITGGLPARQEVRLPPIDLATAAVFAPPEVVAGDQRGEFRQTVVVFLRIPDVPDAQLENFASVFLELQRGYGGLASRIDFGDKGCSLMVVWGAPTAYENDIERGLGLVLDLQKETQLPVSAGITYYIAHAGYVGGRLFDTYTAYGWGVNLAARLMMSAAGNEIRLDERIHQRIESRFHSDYVAEQTIKGFSQKQKVYVLRGRKSGSEALFRGKMVGRQGEIEALSEFIAPIWEGKYAGAAGVWGEAGMGKSRLMYEFRRSELFKEHACLWALCQCDEIVRRSLNPFRYWLMRYFEILPGDEAEARLGKLTKKVDDLIAVNSKSGAAADLKRGRPFLASLIDLEWPHAPPEPLDAQARYDNTISALIALLKAESLRQPLILWVEDAQYLDEDSAAFIPRLKRALEADPIAHPVAILMTTRWHGTKVLLEEGLVDHDIDVAPLTEASIMELCADFLGKPPATALARLINARSEGNPFFTEQILRYLQEQGLLTQEASGEWNIDPEAAPSTLPADLSTMMLARLDQLEARVREVIQAASVLGRVFDVPVLKRMLPNDRSLQDGISAAEQAAIWSPLSETRYLFNHALLRDMAYNMQVHSRRRELHASAYAALKDEFGSDAPRHYPDLAYHSEQGGLTTEARLYLDLAAKAASDEYQNAQALDFFRRALELSPRDDLKGQYRLHRECEKIVTLLGRIDERKQEVDGLQALAESIGDPGSVAEVLLLRSRLEGSVGDYGKSAEFAEQARQLASQVGRQDVAVAAHTSLVHACCRRGMYKEAVEHGEKGVALARVTRAAQEEAEILNMLGSAFLDMKNPSAARSYFEQSLAIFRAEDDVRGVARLLSNLGLVAGYQGNYTNALGYHEQALRLARQIDEREVEGRQLGNMGWISGLLGDYPKARAYMQQVLQIAREMGDRYTETFALINLSSYAAALGEPAAAIESAEQGLSLARGSQDRSAEAWALTYLGHGLLDSSRLDAAREAYEAALAIRRDLDQPVLGTEPAAGLARALWLEGQSAGAAAHVNSVVAQLEQDGTLEGTDQPLRVYLSCYLVLDGMQDGRAAGMLTRAHDMLNTRANGITDPAVRKVFLEDITYNREILSLWEQHH